MRKLDPTPLIIRKLLLADDAEASLNHLKLPVRLRQLVRSTNLLERTFEEGRRRTKVIPRFFAEKPCLKLVFAALIRACEKWARVKFSETELEQLVSNCIN